MSAAHATADPAPTTRSTNRAWVDHAEEPGQILEVLTTPELAFSLITIGLLAAMLWTTTPALTKTGAAAAILLLTGLAALTAAPPTPIAITLLLLAASSLWFEVRFVPGLGLYAIAGWFALTLAGFTLHGTWTGAHPAIVVPLATLTALGTYLTGRRSWQHIHADPMNPAPLLIDRTTIVLHTDGQHGHAVLAGSLWPIKAPRGHLAPGQPIRVIAVTGHTLLVEPHPTGTGHQDD